MKLERKNMKVVMDKFAFIFFSFFKTRLLKMDQMKWRKLK